MWEYGQEVGQCKRPLERADQVHMSCRLAELVSGRCHRLLDMSSCPRDDPLRMPRCDCMNCQYFPRNRSVEEQVGLLIRLDPLEIVRVADALAHMGHHLSDNHAGPEAVLGKEFGHNVDLHAAVDGGNRLRRAHLDSLFDVS